MKNPTEELKFKSTKFYGMYRGVVEDNSDPDKRGRVQVRVWGVHSEDKTLLPVTSLPWAEAATDLLQGGVAGKGRFVLPLIGSQVWVFFENGDHMAPIYFASCSNYQTDPNYGMDPAQGFHAGSEPSVVNEADWNRLARDNDDVTSISTRSAGRTTDVSIAGGGSWDEPSVESYTNYPNRNVLISLKSGFMVFAEDTSAGNHSFLWHPTNSYIDISSVGDRTDKIYRDQYSLIGRNFYQYIINNISRTIAGNEQKLIQGDSIQEVKGTSTLTCDGTLTLDSPTIEMDATTVNINATTINLGSGGVAVTVGLVTGPGGAPPHTHPLTVSTVAKA